MPAQETTSPNRFDTYLAQIESRERKKRRRYQMAGGLAVLLLGTTAVWWFSRPDDQGPLRQYEAASLNYSMVKNLFEEENARIVVAHPAIGTDTIYSPEDYLSLQGLLDQLDANAFQAETGTPADVPATFAVDIAGMREAGSTLVFTIENYDESLTYLIDFGNDVRREVKRSISYAYGAPGNYRLRLIATNEHGSSSIYNKSLQISRSGQTTIAEAKPNPAPQEAPAPVPAQEAPVASAASGQPGLTSLRGAPVSSPSIAQGSPNLRENAPAISQPAESPAPASFNEPLIASQVAPAYPGGSTAMGNFIRGNYRYPRAAQDANVEGTVYVQFVVNVDGSISNARVIRGIGSGCDEEALRLVNMMPKWVPGKQAGSPVAVYHTVPIRFQLIR